MIFFAFLSFSLEAAGSFGENDVSIVLSSTLYDTPEKQTNITDVIKNTLDAKNKHVKEVIFLNPEDSDDWAAKTVTNKLILIDIDSLDFVIKVTPNFIADYYCVINSARFEEKSIDALNNITTYGFWQAMHMYSQTSSIYQKKGKLEIKENKGHIENSQMAILGFTSDILTIETSNAVPKHLLFFNSNFKAVSQKVLKNVHCENIILFSQICVFNGTNSEYKCERIFIYNELNNVDEVNYGKGYVQFLGSSKYMFNYPITMMLSRFWLSIKNVKDSQVIEQNILQPDIIVLPNPFFGPTMPYYNAYPEMKFSYFYGLNDVTTVNLKYLDVFLDPVKKIGITPILVGRDAEKIKVICKKIDIFGNVIENEEGRFVDQKSITETSNNYKFDLDPKTHKTPSKYTSVFYSVNYAYEFSQDLDNNNKGNNKAIFQIPFVFGGFLILDDISSINFKDDMYILIGKRVNSIVEWTVINESLATLVSDNIGLIDLGIGETVVEFVSKNKNKLIHIAGKVFGYDDFYPNKLLSYSNYVFNSPNAESDVESDESIKIFFNRKGQFSADVHLFGIQDRIIYNSIFITKGKDKTEIKADSGKFDKTIKGDKWDMLIAKHVKNVTFEFSPSSSSSFSSTLSSSSSSEKAKVFADGVNYERSLFGEGNEAKVYVGLSKKTLVPLSELPTYPIEEIPDADDKDPTGISKALVITISVVVTIAVIAIVVVIVVIVIKKKNGNKSHSKYSH